MYCGLIRSCKPSPPQPHPVAAVVCVWALAMSGCAAAPAPPAPAAQDQRPAAANYDPDRAFVSLDQITPRPSQSPGPSAAARPVSARGARQIAKAASLYRQRRYTEAGLQLERALQSDPQSPEVHRELARVLKAAGSLERCRTHLQKVLELNADDLVVHYLLGVTAADQGDTQQAIGHLRIALVCSNAASVPDFRALVLFRLGELLHSEGYLTASLEAYRLYGEAAAALEEEGGADPELATVLRVHRSHAGRPISMVYERLGRFEQAAEALTTALQDGGPELADRKRLVRLWSQAGRHEKALAEVHRILAEDTTAIDLLLETHRLAGHPDQAAEDLAALAASKPDEPRFLFAYVDLLQKLNRSAEAAARLRQFADAHPHQLEVQWRLFDLCAAREAWDEALAVAAGAIRTDATTAVSARWKVAQLPPAAVWELVERGEAQAAADRDYAVPYLLGCLALEDDRLEQAGSLLGRALEQSPGFVPAKVELAALYNRQYRWEDCLALLAGLDDEPGDARVEWLRGQACAGLDRDEQAAVHFSAAVRLNRNDTLSMKALAELYERTGKPLRAIRQHRAVLGVNPLDEESREALIMLYVGTDDREEAVAQLDELRKQAASPNRVARCLAFLQLNQRAPDLDRFRQTLTEAMEAAGPDAKSLTLICLIFIEEDRYEEALAVANQAVELNPDDSEARLALAQAYQMTLQFEKSAEQLGHLLQRHPNRTSWVRDLADVLATVQDYDGALAVLRKQLDRADLDDADRERYRLDLLDTLGAARRFDERIEVLGRWQSESPDDANIQEGLVNAYLAADRAADALLLVASWHEAHSTSIGLLSIYTDLLVRTEQAERAFQLALERIEDDPDNDGLQLLLMALLREAGRYDDALELATNCLVDTQEVLAFQDQTLAVYAAAGRHTDAVELLGDLIYQQAHGLGVGRQLAPDFLRLRLATHLMQADKADEAIKRLKRWVEQTPDPVARLGFLLMLAGAQQQRGQVRQAIETLKQAYELDPRDATVNNDLAYNWAEAGVNLEEAEKRLRYAVAQEPRNNAFLDSLGWVLYKKGDFGGAIRWLARASGTGAEDDAVIFDHLGDALWRAGRGAEALEYWRRARSLAQKVLADADGFVRSEDRRVLDSATQKIARVQDGQEAPVAPLGVSVEPSADDEQGAHGQDLESPLPTS